MANFVKKLNYLLRAQRSVKLEERPEGVFLVKVTPWLGDGQRAKTKTFSHAKLGEAIRKAYVFYGGAKNEERDRKW